MNKTLRFGINYLLSLYFLSSSPLLACSLSESVDVIKGKTLLTRSSVEKQAPRLFGLDTKKLPSNYTGIDPYLVWKILYNSQVTKQEYETSNQHILRKDLSIPYEIKYGFNTSHSLPFVTELSELVEYRKFEYDADAKTLYFKVKTAIGSNYYDLTVQESSASDSYIGSTIFGLKARVARILNCETTLRFKQPLDITDSRDDLFRRRRSNLVVPIPASPEQAQSIRRKKWSLLLVIKPVAPFISPTEFNALEPTINLPATASTTTRIINGELQALIIFERKTGTILASRTYTD